MKKHAKEQARANDSAGDLTNQTTNPATGQMESLVFRQKSFRFPAQPQEWKLVSLRDCPVEKPMLDTPGLVADYWRKHVPTHPYFNPDCECLVAVILDVRRRVKGHYMITMGLVDTVLIHPREVFRVAILACASYVVLVHNHPSGDPSPSESDLTATHKLIRAGILLKIELLDHIVMGKDTHVSLRAMGIFGDVPFTKPD
jgi:hypothetical protein